MEVLKSVVQFVVIAFVAFIILIVKHGNRNGHVDSDDIIYGGITSIVVTVIIYIAWWAFT